MPMPQSATHSARPAFDLTAVQPVVATAVAQSAASLSAVAGLWLSVAPTDVRMVSLAEASLAAGQPDEPALVVYVAMSGEGHGHVLLILEEPMARELLGLLLGEDPMQVAFDAFAVSALAECGNITCSAFLNALANACGLRLEATPPVVVNDMRGAVVDMALADIALTGDEAMLIGTRMALAEHPGRAVTAHLLVIPSPETLDLILRRLAERAAEVPGVAHAC